MRLQLDDLRGVRLLALAVVFGVLVTANSAGYRYGVSDQAFYIPAVDLARDPSLFPRDRDLLQPQARLTVMDELLAEVNEATNVELEPLFFAGYLLTLGLFALGVVVIGGRLYSTAWGTATLAMALTLRHRIMRTGVNTFEGYFHPRVLAFSVGLIAVGALWRGHRWIGLLLALAASAIHPTTGSWFVLWIAVAWLVIVRPSARQLTWLAVPAFLAAAAFAGAGLSARLVEMDAGWRAVFAGRDYLFPTTDWNLVTWLTNLIGPALVIAGFTWRERLGVADRSERGVVIGALALVLSFVASLPLVAAHVALAVQLQLSRVLWPLDLLGTAYLVWMLTESPGLRVAMRCRVAVVLVLVVTASAARGYYVLRVEHSNPLVAIWPEESDWQRLGRWIRKYTAVDAHVLADPEHVWPYGSSLRVVADRDVLTENVKDAAMAIYERDVAMRVRERRLAVGDFSRLDEQDAMLLARRYDLDYLVSERPLRLSVVHLEGRLRLYAIGGRP